MTTQVVQAKLIFSDGTIGLFNGSDGDGGTVTDGNLTELLSDQDFYVVSSSAGTQFPGKQIISAQVIAGTFCSYAYVLDRSGNIGCMLPPGSRATMTPYPVQEVAQAYTLQPGDTLQVMTAA